MPIKNSKIHPMVKEMSGFDRDTPDQIVLDRWNEAIKSVCKPGWELKYCPYGILIEDFPMLPPTKDSSEKHNEYLRKCLETGKLGSGEKIDDNRREMFEKMLRESNPSDYPETIPQQIIDASCHCYGGHICPVYYVQSGATETQEARREGRNIPFKMKIRIARRDNYTCQECRKHLRDEEIEFDHIIPASKGGSSEEHNLRLTCFKCNRLKSNKIEI